MSIGQNLYNFGGKLHVQSLFESKLHSVSCICEILWEKCTVGPFQLLPVLICQFDPNNSLVAGRCDTYFNIALPNSFHELSSSPKKPSDCKSTLFNVMAWYQQVISNYLSQCRPKFMSTYGITSPQWVKFHKKYTLHDPVEMIWFKINQFRTMNYDIYFFC